MIGLTPGSPNSGPRAKVALWKIFTLGRQVVGRSHSNLLVGGGDKCSAYSVSVGVLFQSDRDHHLNARVYHAALVLKSLETPD